MKRLKTTSTQWTRALMAALLVLLASIGAQAGALDESEVTVVTDVPAVDGGQTSNWGTGGTENYDKLVDGKLSTKYGLSKADPYVEFHYEKAFVPKGYALWTAGDEMGKRNPTQWTVKAKLNADDPWTTLATVDNANNDQLPMADNTKTTFALDNTSAYRYFRFEAVRRLVSTNEYQFQLAELQFYVEKTEEPNKELLTNGRCDGTYNGWTKDDGSGDGWAIGDDNGVYHWASSHKPCTLTQTVTLSDFSISASDIDDGKVACVASAEVRVKNWNNTGARVNSIIVYMLNADNNKIGSVTVLNSTMAYEDWTTFKTDVFVLVAGTRKLMYEVQGQDGANWKGQFGPAYRNLSLKYTIGSQGEQPVTDVQADYERALAAIVDGQKYRVYTVYNGQKYYVTADGKLSAAVADAPLFEFKKVAPNTSADGAGEYGYGFQVKLQKGSYTYYFSNADDENGGKLKVGYLNTRSDFSRTTWETQVFFLNSEGKYAVRSTNAKSGTTGWAKVGSAFWTVEAGQDGPVAQYDYDMNYVWQLEDAGGDTHVHDLLMVEQVSPTCTEAGYAAYWQCSTCGKMFSDENAQNEMGGVVEIPALGHRWSDWVVISEATPDTPGVKKRTCERDPSHVETEDIEFSPGNLPVPEGAIDIAQLSSGYTAKNGDVLAGMGNENTHIFIADGATVTLHNVDNSHISTSNGWPGIYCRGNAKIVLEGSNKLRGGQYYQPGIFVPTDKTLTIEGDGSLDVRGNGGCGIGTGWQLEDCGNIVINSGHVTAVGGMHSAGIGSSFNRKCGTITINGGTVIATGGSNAPGIGAGYAGKCGTVTINSGFSRVTATKGNDSPNSIGDGKSDGNGNSYCSGVIILNQKDKISESPYTILAINAENFPDEAFRKYLLEEDYGQDGVLTSAEIAHITELEVGYVMNEPIKDGQDLGTITPVEETKLIESLQGIAFFTALEKLCCDGNLLTTLDLSGNTALKQLSCNTNQLTKLDVTKNTALTELSCSENQLTTIDLTKNPELRYLNLSENKLTTLDVSQTPKLVEIRLAHNLIGEYGMDALVSSLNTMEESDGATLYVMADDDFEGNVMHSNQVEAANQKHWAIKYWNNDQLKWMDYAGSNPVITYPVWVGDTQVTDANKDDVLGDGTVTYEPGVGTGTLNFASATTVINGMYNAAKIYADGIDLTINAPKGLVLENSVLGIGMGGSNRQLTVNGDITFKTTSAPAINNCSVLTVNGNLTATISTPISCSSITVNGNVNITASMACLSAATIVLNGEKHVLSASSPCISSTNSISVTGDLTATSTSAPAISAKGDVTVVSGTWTLDGGNTRAIEWGNDANLNIPSTYAIIAPENAQIKSAGSGYNARKTVADAEGNEATHVVIGEPVADVTYTVSITGGKAYAQEPDPYELQQPVTEFKAGATVYVVPDAMSGAYVIGWEASPAIDITKEALIYRFKMPAENVTLTPEYDEQTPLTWDLSDGNEIWIGDNEDDLMALEGLLLPFWQKGQLLANQYYDYFDLDLDGTNDIMLYEDEDTENIVIGRTDNTNLKGFYEADNISPFGPVTFKFSELVLTLDEEDHENGNQNILEKYEGQKVPVILKRTLKTGGWNTFTSPVTFSNFTTVFGEGVKVKQLKDATLTDGVLNLKFEDVAKIKGQTPYLVKVAADVDLSQKSITGTVCCEPVIVETAALKFIPTMGLPHVQYTDDPRSVLFIGAGSKLYYADAVPLDIKGFRAYFLLNEPDAVRSVRMDFGDGETTGIVAHKANDAHEPWYTVDGRRLSKRPTAKGVYINNGRKTIVK